MSESVEFRDPIHGFIEVLPHERRIIDTFEFQRLRRIRQVGLTSYVYHGAEHSRFGHSLGVMHLAGEAFNSIWAKKGRLIEKRLGWSESGKKTREKLYHTARLAGLLHDVGHAPFSHTGERELFPSGLRHEDYTVRLVSSGEIGKIIDESASQTGVSSEDVRNILHARGLHPAQFIRELISSPWDVDKMDYLLRDSHYCGVEYGRYDLRRLIGSLTLEEVTQKSEPRLAIEEGGIHVLEALIAARYFMFTQVYFHDVRRAYDLVLTEFVKELLQDERGEPVYPGPDKMDEFLRWDDSRVLSAAAKRADPTAQDWAWYLVSRTHPKAVYWTLPSPDSGTATKVEELYSKVETTFPETRFWLDRAIDHPEHFKDVDIWVQIESTGKWRAFSSLSTLLSGLQAIGQVRIYANVRDDRALKTRIKDYCKRYLKDIS